MSSDFQARTRQFRAALGAFATGVTIVTTRNPAGEDIGLTGRRVGLELVAVAKAAESDAERNLGYGETQLLKRALRGIISETDPGPPPLVSSTYPE